MGIASHNGMWLYLSHVVGNVEVHVNTDYQLYEVLCQTNILMYDRQMEGSARK